ncbi:hypothetical protein AB204_19155 [Xenorhabdus khoisanae]|uniref:Barstar (barnase inhibitor) domain-containing protein n=1 Tax=Xenorhabdus khoisanae TaxID=880157 RepID=A0A0J5FMS9_9GAMM|nr:hypothetical protein [Xenorhabdus khoisanae]KMJ43551.1 hypothetical protein AB204_19155 [Xenorhabdus khoisanae]
MIYSKYCIYINEVECAIADKIDFFHLSNYEGDNCELILLKSKEVKIQNSIKVKKEDIITISYYINEICAYEFDGHIINKEIILEEKQELSLVIKVPHCPFLSIITILNEWVKGKDLLYWRNSHCIEAKKLWLTACLYWQQIFPPKFNKILNASLDLEGVNNYLDFFCMLGEAFWGKRGYIGRDFHGFDDLLGDLSYEKAEINIYIENMNELKLFLERISPPDCNYYDTFMEILVDKKCNIQKK